jgi:hypothetical protein
VTATDRASAVSCEGTAGAPTTTGILTGAATLIEELGWTQGDWTENGWNDTRPCPICVLAALNLAAGRDPSATITGIVFAAACALATHLGLAHLLTGDDVHEALIEVLGSGWNDDHARTQDEVVQALRAAAASQREAGH